MSQNKNNQPPTVPIPTDQDIAVFGSQVDRTLRLVDNIHAQNAEFAGADPEQGLQIADRQQKTIRRIGAIARDSDLEIMQTKEEHLGELINGARIGIQKLRDPIYVKFDNLVRLFPARKDELTGRRDEQLREVMASEQAREYQGIISDLEARYESVKNPLDKLTAKPFPLPLAWYALRDKLEVPEEKPASDQDEHDSAERTAKKAESVAELNFEDEDSEPPISLTEVRSFYDNHYAKREESGFIEKFTGVLLQMRGELNEPFTLNEVLVRVQLRSKEEPSKIQQMLEDTLLDDDGRKALNDFLKKLEIRFEWGKRRTDKLIRGRRVAQEDRELTVFRLTRLNDRRSDEYQHQKKTNGESGPDTETYCYWPLDQTYNSLDIQSSKERDTQQAQTTQKQTADRPRSREQKKNWKTDFYEQVMDAVSKLEAAGLLSEKEEIDQRVVYIKRTSETLGTKTNVERLVEAGLLKRGQTSFGASDLVMMSIYNSFQRELTEKTRRAEAKGIISELLKEYFTNKKQAEATEK